MNCVAAWKVSYDFLLALWSKWAVSICAVVMLAIIFGISHGSSGTINWWSIHCMYRYIGTRRIICPIYVWSNMGRQWYPGRLPSLFSFYWDALDFPFICLKLEALFFPTGCQFWLFWYFLGWQRPLDQCPVVENLVMSDKTR